MSSNIVEWLEETAWVASSFNRNLNTAAAEIKRLRSILATVSEEREVYRNAQISTESGYHAERALADKLAEALRAVRADRPTAHTDAVWFVINTALGTYEEARRER